MLKSIFKSRIFWLIMGVIIGCVVIPFIPGGIGGVILLFLWKQKWGLLIGIGITILLRKIRGGRESKTGWFKLNFKRKEKQPKQPKQPKPKRKPNKKHTDDYDELDWE